MNAGFADAGEWLSPTTRCTLWKTHRPSLFLLFSSTPSKQKLAAPAMFPELSRLLCRRLVVCLSAQMTKSRG